MIGMDGMPGLMKRLLTLGIRGVSALEKHPGYVLDSVGGMRAQDEAETGSANVKI